jgi:hypothetical protein
MSNTREARRELPIRIVLVDPPSGVTYAIQRGRGSDYEPAFSQTPKHGDVTFEFAITAAAGKESQPNFLGEYVQGPTGRRYVYVDVGRYAHQADTEWARRMIIRLDDVAWPLIDRATKPGKCLEARIPGTGSDGGPSCATVKPIGGWKVVGE